MELDDDDPKTDFFVFVYLYKISFCSNSAADMISKIEKNEIHFNVTFSFASLFIVLSGLRTRRTLNDLITLKSNKLFFAELKINISLDLFKMK